MDLGKRASARENVRSEEAWTRRLERHPEGLVRAGDLPTQAPAQRTWVRSLEIPIDCCVLEPERARRIMSLARVQHQQ